ARPRVRFRSSTWLRSTATVAPPSWCSASTDRQPTPPCRQACGPRSSSAAGSLDPRARHARWRREPGEGREPRGPGRGSCPRPGPRGSRPSPGSRRHRACRARGSRLPAAELLRGPQACLHGGVGCRSVEALHQDGGATVAVDRNLTLGRAVSQSQLRTACFTGRAERDRRPRASVVVVHEGLEHVHRILLWYLLGHASRLSLGELRSRSTITLACPLSSSW